MNKKDFIEQARLTGAKGGKSRSKAKKLAARKNLAAHARPGKAVARMIRDVEAKMLRNRESYANADDIVRAMLDKQFDKWVRVRDTIRKQGSNGVSK